MAATGPRIVHQSTKAHKTVDTEDVDLKCLAQPDGTLVTEKKKTTEHEELFDEDLPEKDDNSTGSQERVDQKVMNKNCELHDFLRGVFTLIISVFQKKMAKQN